MNWRGTDERRATGWDPGMRSSGEADWVEDPAIRPRSRVRVGGGLILKGLALAAVLAAAAWAYSANFGSGRPAMDMSMRVTSGSTPFPVLVVPVERSGLAASVTYTGSVAPFAEEDIYPRVTGRIVEMPVYPGDAVRAGQVVARLDDVELSSRLRESEAMLATAEANRTQMEADVTAARHGTVQMERELAMVEAELVYARSVAARSERLVASGAISRQEHENDRSMAASLEAKRDAARAKLEQARAMEASAGRKVEAAGSMVAQAQAQLRTTQVVRDYVTIVAPSAGYVVKRLVAPGVLVQPGMPILKIAQVDRVRLQANVGEKDVALIRVGAPVTVTTAAAGQPAISARVTSVFPFVDQGPRTAVVEAVVENPGRRLLPGQYVTMQVTTGQRADALTVPRGAVVRLAGKASVWVERDGTAEPRPVVTGLENPERVEIVSGLEADERVIVRGHDGLYAGASVSEASTLAPSEGAGADHGAGMPGVEGKRDAGRVPPGGPPVRSQPKEEGHAGH